MRSFDPARIRSPRTQEFLLQHTSVSEQPDLTAGYPDGIPNRIAVALGDGRVLSKTVRYPRGHARNPMTDPEVIDKFNANVKGRLTPEQARTVQEQVWSLDNCRDVAEILPLLMIHQKA